MPSPQLMQFALMSFYYIERNTKMIQRIITEYAWVPWGTVVKGK